MTNISVKIVWLEFMHCIRGRQMQLFGARLEKVTSQGTWPSFEQLVLFITWKRQRTFPEVNSGRPVKHELQYFPFSLRPVLIFADWHLLANDVQDGSTSSLYNYHHSCGKATEVFLLSSSLLFIISILLSYKLMVSQFDASKPDPSKD